MLIHLPSVSPIFAAYEAQKQLFEAALDTAICQAAEKVGSECVAKMFELPAAHKALKAA